MTSSKVTLVTGCRSGFGKLVAIEAARRGHTVYAGLRDLDTAAELVDAAAGLPVIPVQLDVTRDGDRAAVVERILSERGRIDGLVNNAGVALGGFLEQIEEDELRHVFEVNVFGLWALTKAVLPVMRSTGQGVVVNVSSISGVMAFPGLGTYSASKFALEGMSEAWRHELGLLGIDLYLVEPGAYATDIWERNRNLGRRVYDPDGPYADLVGTMDKRFKDLVSSRVRPPEEVALHIVDLLDGPRRKLRHPMGPGTGLRSAMKRFLPFWVIELAVRRLFTG